MKRLLLLLALLFLVSISACVPKRANRIYKFTQAANQVEKKGVTAPSAPVTGQFLYSDSPEIRKAMEEFVRTGKAATIKKTGFIQYPYGESQPVIYCAPLRACDIELEAGEEILGLAPGDSVRWAVETIYSGGTEKIVPHVIVKPKDYDISTNLVITTSRRTYHIGLISKENDYVRQFRFYYPHDLIKYAANEAKIARLKKEQDEEIKVADLPSFTAEDLNLSYRIEGDYDIPWRPVRAFDDGAHVYIQMPAILKATEAPALLIRRRGSNEGELVNYRLKRNYYIVDKLFEEAVMIAGVGGREEVTITKR